MKNFKYILTHSSGNLTVEYNPINWSNFNVVFRRSKRYHSVLRKQILNVEFPLDGKAYIDTIYETFGIDTEIGCEIQYLNKQTLAYATLFDGVIDLSKWEWLRDTTSVKVVDSTNMALFSARDEVEIPINRDDDLDGNAVDVYTYLNQFTVEGVNIEEKAEYDDSSNVIDVDPVETGPFTDHFGVDDGDYDFNTIGADADLPDVTLGGASGPLYTNNSGGSLDVRFRIKTTIEGNVAITGSNAWSFRIRAFTGLNGLTTAIDIDESGTGADTRNFNTSYDSGVLTETLANGETIEIYHQWEGSVTGGDTIDPNFDIEPIFIQVFEIIPADAETDVDMPPLHELGAKLLEIITGLSDPLNAPLLGRTDSEPRTYGGDGAYSLNAVASGFMLRGYRNNLPPMKSTFADFFKSIDALFNLGFWYDQDNTEFVIAAKEDFYEVANIITLGEVKDLEISVSQDEYFNKIKCGYQKEVEYDDVNGQQVPNVPMEFANDGRRIQNTLDISSIYRGDDYGIELSRQSDFRTTNAEDTRYDNDNFFIIGQRDAGDYRTLQGYDNYVADSITGVYSPETRLNLDISPKRNLLRHGNQLSIPLFITEGSTNFMRSQFDLDLATQKSGDPVINEKDDLAFSDLEEPLYYPEVYNFTSELSIENILQLISDPHGYVDFDYLGVTYSGYILEVSSEPFNRRGNWTLLKRNPNR